MWLHALSTAAASKSSWLLVAHRAWWHHSSVPVGGNGGNRHSKPFSPRSDPVAVCQHHPPERCISQGQDSGDVFGAEPGVFLWLNQSRRMSAG